MKGKVFGRLTTIEISENRLPYAPHKVLWHCVCECGGTIDADPSHLHLLIIKIHDNERKQKTKTGKRGNPRHNVGFHGKRFRLDDNYVDTVKTPIQKEIQFKKTAKIL